MQPGAAVPVEEPAAADTVHPDIQAFLDAVARSPPDSPERANLAALPGFEHLVNAMPSLAPAAQPQVNQDNAAILQAVGLMFNQFNGFQEQLTQIQTAQTAAAIKPVPDLPTIEDPVLKAAASSAVEAIKMNPAEGEHQAQHSLPVLNRSQH